MDNYDTMTQSPYANILGDGSGGILPESLTPILIISFVVLNVLALIVMVFWIMGMIRRRKVQTAVLDMQKDVAEIKKLLAEPMRLQSSSKPTTNTPVNSELTIGSTVQEDISTS